MSLSLFHEFHLKSSTPIIFSDNLGNVLISANPDLHSWTKYFELDLHYVCDKVHKQELFVHQVLAHSQITDVLTKPVSGTAFSHFFLNSLCLAFLNPNEFKRAC